MSAPASPPRPLRTRTAAFASAAIFAGLAALHACRTSPHPRLAALSHPGSGAAITLRLLDDRPNHYGELLAVEESTLVVLTVGRRLAVARLSDVARLTWSVGSSSYEYRANVLISPTFRRDARLASRFPYGMPEPAVRVLLADLGQPAPDTLRRAGR